MLLISLIGLLGIYGQDGPIYSQDGANVLLETFFPSAVRASGTTNAFEWRGKLRLLENFEQIQRNHIQSAHVANDQPFEIRFPWDVIDSKWLYVLANPDRATELIRHAQANNALDIINRIMSADAFPDVLEKSLLQRDIYQLYWIFAVAGSQLTDKETQDYSKMVMAALSSLHHRLQLSREEYAQLTRIVFDRKAAARKTYSSRLVFDRSVDYLPEPVTGDPGSWFELPFFQKAAVHYRNFGGRSFVRIFVRVPGMDREQFFRIWKGLLDEYGEMLFQRSPIPGLPEGTETLLLRTATVFLDDGTVADSGLPEWVGVRAFRYSERQLDQTSSDYLGTYHWVYKMSRKALFSSKDGLGLHRETDDTPSFYGFYGDAPDQSNSYSETLATTRYNCIGCHSEQHYGTNTIFSLSRQLPSDSGDSYLFDNMLLRTQEEGFYLLNTPEYRHLIDPVFID